MSESDSCALFCQAHKKEKDNKDANKSYTYTYDSRGNLLSKKTYAFTLGTLGTAQKTDSYGYATDSWKDRLTSYNGQTVTYDSIGNPLTYNNGSAYTFTWEGRQMQSASKGNQTYSYTYNSDGLRASKTVGNTTYHYYWNSGKLIAMTYDDHYMIFTYTESGTPFSVTCYDAYLDKEYECLYITNLQGDVVGIYDAAKSSMVISYTYDAWGRLVGKDGTSSDYAQLEMNNPLLYRGYQYDYETGFYYLQSRYYDPSVGRFLNADSVLSIHPSSSECNLFRYCNNNPINRIDETGTMAVAVATSGATYAAFVAWLSTLGSANFWNPVGWIILGVIAAGVITWAAVTLYNRWKASAASKTRTLSDVSAKEPVNGKYYLAYIDKSGSLVKIGNAMSFTVALSFLGIKKASGSLSKRYRVSISRPNNVTKEWGIYTTKQIDAKALAIVLGCTASPEVHGSYMYGHYHDIDHLIHIWYGQPIIY